MNQSLRSLRTELKQRRSALTDQELAISSAAVAKKFWQIPFVQRAKNIAIYLATAGEIDCLAIAENAWLRKKAVFVPILDKTRLKFAPLQPGSKLTFNRFEILEPVYRTSALVAPQHLDIVVTPLLAFDAQLNRIGMGGGFYDRSFAFCKRRKIYSRPRLVGVAHSFQQLDHIYAEHWDVPMHLVISEKEVFGNY